MSDHSTQQGATALAYRLQSYWLKRGYHVVVDTHIIAGRDKHWGMHSNTINGLPQGYNGDKPSLGG